MARKPRKCRICKKRPVWTGGDVKSPGRVCKKCYHKHVWPQRRRASEAPDNEQTYSLLPVDPPPYPLCYDPFYYYVHVPHRCDDEWLGDEGDVPGQRAEG